MHVIHFDTSGWRARFDDGFDEESVGRIASSLGLAWGTSCDAPANVVYVAFDTRHDSRRLALLAAGTLASFGLRVLVSNVPCPTPALGWSVSQDDDCVGGISITASDFPCEYGGIIVRGRDGGPVSAGFARQVDAYASTPGGSDAGVFETVDFVGPYLDHLETLVDAESIARANFRIVVDSMYGTGRGIVASLLGRLGCDTIEIHDSSAEDFSGIHPQPVEPWVDDCEQRVVTEGADFGIVLDGDCGRSSLVTERGHLVAPHNIAPLLMDHLVRRRGREGRVVMTLPCSARVTRQAERLGCELSAVPVGFQRLHGEIGVGDVLLACDEYGGVCLPEHLPERDGILCALYLVEMLALSSSSPTELVRDLEEQIGAMYYARKDLRLDAATMQTFSNLLPGLNPRHLAGRVPTQVSHADGMKVYFENGAWVMLRPSRTQPVIRAYAEAESVADRDNLLGAACDIARGNLVESLAT